MAGSKVRAANMTAMTARIVPTARPSRYCWPTRNKPHKGDEHGGPGEQHGPPGGGHGPDDGVAGVEAFTEALAVAGDDEQRVVDPDAEPDHGHQLRAEAGIDQQMTDQGYHAVPDADADQRGDDRQAHRHHGPEGQEHDDDRSGDADAFARPGRRRHHGADRRPAERHLQARLRIGLGLVDHPLDVRRRDLGGDGVELDRRERRVPVSRP